MRLLVPSLLVLAAASAQASDITRAIVADVSATRIEAYIRMLASFGTRNSLSDTVSETRGIAAARRWIKAELERCA